MLPKIWKKFLLAICIIACLFNVTAKIVNRVSLEKVITSQKEGVNVRELLNITDKQQAINKQTNTVSNYSVEDETVADEQEVTEPENDVEEEPEENKKGNGGVTQEEFFDRIFKDNAFTTIVGN